MKGGKREGAGRPKQAEKRVSLTVRVKESTRSTIKEQDLKIGPMVDKIVEGLK